MDDKLGLMDEEELDREFENFMKRFDNIKKMPDKTREEIARKRKAMRKLSGEIDDRINMYEVEDFLENGPGGIDPE